MKRKLLISLILCVLWPSLSVAGDLQTIEITTGPYVCNNTTQEVLTMQEVFWVNTAPPIRIRKANLWQGADRKTKADIYAVAYRISTGTKLIDFGWDHYQDPTGRHDKTEDYGRNWIEIGTGDGIALYAFCDGANGGRSHAVLTVWYE